MKPHYHASRMDKLVTELAETMADFFVEDLYGFGESVNKQMHARAAKALKAAVERRAQSAEDKDETQPYKREAARAVIEQGIYVGVIASIQDFCKLATSKRN